MNKYSKSDNCNYIVAQSDSSAAYRNKHPYIKTSMNLDILE